MVDRDRLHRSDDVGKARELAHRFGCDFVDLHRFTLNEEILKRVPAELMFRFNFVPLQEMPDGRLAISIADPSQLMLIDEISLLLGRRLVVRVAALSQIAEILRGIDPQSKEMVENPPDEPLRPSDPDARVRVPKRPRPHLRSGAVKAVPDEEQ